MKITTQTKALLTAAAVCFGAGSAIADTQIIWRSASTGTIGAAPSVPNNPTGPTTPGETYSPTKITMSGKTSVKYQDDVLLNTVVEGGSGDVSYNLSVDVNTGFPPGLTLDMNTGQISGKAYRPGTYYFLVQVYDRKTHKYSDGPMIAFVVSQ